MTDAAARYSDLLFGVRRSVRYHRRRERFLDVAGAWFRVLTAGAGAATALALLAEFSAWQVSTAAVATAVFSVLDIVFMPERTARLHNELARDFIALEQDMLRIPPDPPQDDVTALVARRLAIEMREPPHLRALNLMCHNELVKAMGAPADNYVDIPWYQRGLMAQLADINIDFLEKRDRELTP